MLRWARPVVSGLARNLGLLVVGVIALSLAGLNEIAGPVALFGLLVVVLSMATGLSRPGRSVAKPFGRSVRRINFLGRYRDPVTGLGAALIVGFAVDELVMERTGRQSLPIVAAAIVLDLAAGSRWPDGTEIGEEVIGLLASIAVVAAMWPLTDSADDAVFLVAMVIVVVVFSVVWLGPRWGLPLPVRLFGLRNGLPFFAGFALLELARTVAYPLGGAGAEVDVWSSGTSPWLSGVTAMTLFAGIAVAVAYGPRFVTGLLGLALLVLTLYMHGVTGVAASAPGLRAG